MIEIEVKNVPDEKKSTIGSLLCSSLVGERTFVDNDIVINYTDYDNIFIILGNDTTNTINLSVNFEDIELSSTE